MDASSREGDCIGDDHEKKRLECALLILDIANRLPTTLITVTTAIMYMRRFYERISPNVAKPVMVAIATLYTALKAENDAKGLRRVVEAAYRLFRTQVPREDSYTYHRMEMNVKKLEAAILAVIGFEDMEVKQPLLILSEAIEAAGEIPRSVASFAYFACTGMMLLTSLPLRYSMEAVAAGSLYYAAPRIRYDLVNEKPNWMKLFSKDLSESEVRRIADEYRRVCKSLDKKWLDAVNNSIKSAFCGLHDVKDVDKKKYAQHQGSSSGGGGGGSQNVVPAPGGVHDGNGTTHTRRMYEGVGGFSGSSTQKQLQHRLPLPKPPPTPPLPPPSRQSNGGAQSTSSSSFSVTTVTKNDQGDALGGKSSSAAMNSFHSLF